MVHCCAYKCKSCGERKDPGITFHRRFTQAFSMDSTESPVCQLCQGKLPEKGYKNQTSSINDLAKVLFLKWDNSSESNTICKTCVAKMENFCEFKFKCLLTEEKLHPYMGKGQSDIDLCKVLETELTGDTRDKHICRFCKQNFAKISTNPLLGSLNNDLQEICKAHFPEIDIYAVKDSFICKSCSQNLSDFGHFTAAWSNNNFTGDWANTTIEMKDDSVDECSIEKKASGSKIKDGIVCVKEEPAASSTQDDNAGLEVIKINDDNIKRRAKKYSVLNRYKCSKCEYSHKHKSSLKIHEKIHKDKLELKLYKCGYCEFQSLHKAAVYMHGKMHKDPSEIKMYKCGECDFQAKIKCHVISHQRMHQTKMYKCTECSFQTKYQESLGRHQILHKDGAEVKVFKCDVCSYTAKRKHNLKGHMLKHQDEGAVMHKCDVCKFETKYPEALSRHKRLVHTHLEKVHQCPHCDYQAKIASYLNKHLLQHTDPSQLKMYYCYYCSHSSKTLSQRNSHMKVAHNPPKFQCAVCGHKFRFKNNLKGHITRMHPRKQWSACTF